MVVGVGVPVVVVAAAITRTIIIQSVAVATNYCCKLIDSYAITDKHGESYDTGCDGETHVASNLLNMKQRNKEK